MSNKMVAPGLFRPPIDFPDVPYDHLLRMAAEHYPHRTAMVYHDLLLTYREVVAMVNAMANGLHELDLQKGIASASAQAIVPSIRSRSTRPPRLGRSLAR